MAKRRMFSQAVTDTDKFKSLPLRSQALYFHLAMTGDDDGFVASPLTTMRGIGCKARDLEILCEAGYIIKFESGVVVIADWFINNTLKNDRYQETIYQAEKAQLNREGTKRYQLGARERSDCIRSGSNPEPQHNLTKIKRTEQKRGNETRAPRFTPPTADEVETYCRSSEICIDAQRFCDYYASKGWRVGRESMCDWQAAVRNWARREQEENMENCKNINDTDRYIYTEGESL